MSDARAAPAERHPACGADEPVPAPPDVLILRDPRESRAKCSLTPLRGRPGIVFVDYRGDATLDARERVLLDPEGEPISSADRGRGLLVIDCAWRRVPKLRRTLTGEPLARRLPPLLTGYPRRSKTFADPASGLASVEALYAALTLLGHDARDLLAGYPWRALFLERNPALRAPA